MAYDAVIAETVMIAGNDGDQIEAYTARPMDSAPRGGVIVIHHLPGYDDSTKEIARRFAFHGYNAVMPNLYWRDAPGAAPDDAAAASRANGGVADEQVVGDMRGAAVWLRGLSNSNGKVASIGFCSGGRHSWLVAGSLDLEAAILCYPGFIVGDVPEQMPPAIHPIPELAATISGPLLGLFGNDDSYPSPEHVEEIDRMLNAHDKPHEFHRYDGAGHAFFNVDRASYRPEAAVDGWEKIFDFLGRQLGATPSSGAA